MTHPYTEIVRNLDDVERGIETPHSMLTCPYLRSEGTCLSGCWSEPRCITDEPMGGWDSRESMWSLADWAREIAADARGQHGLVKRARDLTRRAEKAATR